MLKDAGATWAIVGHTKHRRFLHKTDESIAQKVAQALKAGLKVMLCIGEISEECEKKSNRSSF